MQYIKLTKYIKFRLFKKKNILTKNENIKKKKFHNTLKRC